MAGVHPGPESSRALRDISNRCRAGAVAALRILRGGLSCHAETMRQIMVAAFQLDFDNRISTGLCAPASGV
ncbi:MAG: hypothetical protein CML66_24105 [Rhodobacteraceae bacterium]|nr:hypothetical protein [Paracoccaceae bacterium]